MAMGHASEADLRLLRSAQRSQLLLTLRALLDQVDAAARRTRHPGGVPSGQMAWRLLCETEARTPVAVEAVLADPTVMAWALRLIRRLNGSAIDPPSTAPLWADLGQFHALAVAAAVRARIPCVLWVPAHYGLVWLPGTGMAGPVARRRWSEAEVHVDGEGAVIHGEAGQVLLNFPLTAPVPGWRPLRHLRGPALVEAEGAGPGPWLDTVSPYRDFTRYPKSPDRSGAGRSQVWEARLADAYALLDRESPADAVALGELVRAFVPRSFRRTSGALVASASSLDAFGAVTMSLPRDVTQAAATLVHETRHQQLNALLNLVHLVLPPGDEHEGGELQERRLYYAPWRSDPRPVRGLLHGVFAFAGVGRFWRRHRGYVTGTQAQHADFEFAVLREQLREAVAALLTDDDLTEAGRLFVEEIADVVATWQDDEIATGPAELARYYCALRRAVWRVRHLEIPTSAAERFAKAWAAGATAPALPSPTMRPRLDLIRPDTFGPLARNRLSAPGAFARRRLRADKSGTPLLRAEYAAVAGDAEQAALGYAEWTAQNPRDPEAWIGAALALPEPTRGTGAALVLDRPEVVASVHRAVTTAGGGFPAPADLAEWLGGGDT
ncbi:aKG-HExxH-type peptide beta-hydroxylase [Streptomyces apricus]